MTPKICNYYVTLRCNDTCEFCSIWRNPEYQNIRESDYQNILEELKKQGVRGLNITGGEPLLREDLPQLLKQAKELGFKIELSTNGILYPEKARLLDGLVDRLFFSLDYPITEEHDRSRGMECFHQVIQSIKLAQELGEKPIINFTMTRDNVRFLPEMVELAEKLKIMVYLNPVYDFHGTQGFENATLFHIRYYFRRKNVLLNLAVLEFIKAGGNKVILPRCKAKETTLTILPDGTKVSPCFFNQGGKQGKENICSSCTRWPYMLPSFSKGLDKYFWLNLFSGFDARRKGLKT
ncbi:MAG: radical SAM protein [Candidatus Margulisiibacteriota bacterium]